jgi:8-hydroxy-5-deazaflavin:NADPH oxidoreductase
MQIAILGAGNIGRTLGAKWAAAGHAVVFGVRDPGSDKARAALGEVG